MSIHACSDGYSRFFSAQTADRNTRVIWNARMLSLTVLCRFHRRERYAFAVCRRSPGVQPVGHRRSTKGKQIRHPL